MPLNFDLVAVNPNDSVGGGGTLAAEMHDTDAHGPYFVWPTTTMDSTISPFVVVAASEVRAMYEALQLGREPLAGGEPTIIPEAIEQDTGAGQGDTSREYNLADTADAIDFAKFAKE